MAFDIGDQVNLKARFRTPDRTPINPTSVTLLVEAPDGTLTSYSSLVTGELANPEPGIWTRDVTATAAGVWSYRWQGAGVAQAAEEARFIVRARTVGP